MSSNTILVVEDEPGILEMLSFSLTRAGFQVWESPSAEDALRRLEGTLPSLVVLDWMLPGLSGVDLAKRLRRDQHTADLPIIMLTARGEEADKLKSFDAGIDDYVTKPFSPRELVARVRALLRRARPERVASKLLLGDIDLDRDTRRVRRGGREIHLGPTEFRLLEYFMEKPGRVFTRAQLLDNIWGMSAEIDERTVDVHVGRLRKALIRGREKDPIRTVRGSGYSLDETFGRE